MKIYFAGAIRGGREDAQLYNDIISYLSETGQVLPEHVGNIDLSWKGDTSRNGEIIEYNKSMVNEVYEGLNPNQIVDFKSLTGDTSDNIPGIPGVGKKTATKLFNEYKTLDSLSKNLDLIKQEKLKNNLLENFNNSIKAKELIQINLKAPVEINLNDIEINNI